MQFQGNMWHVKPRDFIRMAVFEATSIGSSKDALKPSGHSRGVLSEPNLQTDNKNSKDSHSSVHSAAGAYQTKNKKNKNNNNNNNSHFRDKTYTHGATKMDSQINQAHSEVNEARQV